MPLDVELPHDQVFGLLPHVHVFALGQVPADFQYIQHLRGLGSSKWSGLAVQPADGLVIVVYNDAHPINRVRTTLMEEFFHIRLDHPPSVLRLYRDDGSRRTFNSDVEREAYGSGAAALVPYAALKQMAASGWSVTRIAKQFRVSRDLVWFRAKVTRVYRLLKQREVRSR